MPRDHKPRKPTQASTKSKAAVLSVAYNVVSTLLKVVGAILTHSVSLTSEAVHSAADVVASLLAYFSVKAAAVPADDDHPYGHGKIESLAGFAESIFLLLTMIFIGNESIHRLVKPVGVEKIDVGLGIMLLSAVTSLAIGLHVQKTGRKTRSLALQSNGQHLLVDCVTSVGVLTALLITRLTGWQSADPILALVLALWIGVNAIRLCHKAYQQLIDQRLPIEEIAELRAHLDANPEIISYHRLRTRLSGSTRHIDVHIVVPNDWSVVEAHRVADAIEKSVAQTFPPAEVVVHVDPFDEGSPEPD